MQPRQVAVIAVAVSVMPLQRVAAVPVMPLLRVAAAAAAAQLRLHARKVMPATGLSTRAQSALSTRTMPLLIQLTLACVSSVGSCTAVGASAREC